MNTTDATPNAGDLRRAAALMCHHATNNLDGWNAVVTEALDHGRATQLLVGVLDLYGHLVPQILTPLGQRMMSDVVLDLAGREVTDQ